MKKEYRLICLAFLLTLMVLLVAGTADCGQRNTTTGVDFMHDWEAAKERANREGKPIMLNFYTDT